MFTHSFNYAHYLCTQNLIKVLCTQIMGNDSHLDTSDRLIHKHTHTYTNTPVPDVKHGEGEIDTTYLRG